MRARANDVFLRFFFLFSAFYLVTLSMGYSLLPDGSHWLGDIMQPAARFTGDLLFGINLRGDHEFYSDSALVYVHVFNILLLSLFAACVWTWKAKTRFTETQLYPLMLTMLRCFLALMLFIYGFSKIYKWQFYLPEPNTLYQTVGNTPRDLLYWSSMGTSYTYSVFMGVIEVIPAFLLLFRKTALPGALISFGVLLNVVFVNMGFDITVKIHSITLLMMSVVLLVPARKRLTAFFTGKASEEWNYPALQLNLQQKWIAPAVKTAVIIMLLLEANWIFISRNTFNGNLAEKPPLYGAYQVEWYAENGQVFLGPNVDDYVFVHSRGYFIRANESGQQDYHFSQPSDSVMMIDPDYYDGKFTSIECTQYNDSLYDFISSGGEIVYQWRVKKLDMRTLPLLQEEFTWVDSW